MTKTIEQFIPINHVGVDQPAVISPSETITYTQLAFRIHKTQERLQSLGIEEGNRVAILSANSMEYVIILLSLWSMKAIACPLHNRLPTNICIQQCEQIHASALITSSEYTIELKDASIIQIGIESLTEIGKSLSVHKESAQLHFDEGREATILFTTGSSGMPKAVLHTLGNHFANARSSNEIIPLTPEDRWLLSLPLYHVGGLSILFRTLSAGATIVIPESQDDIPATIDRQGITHLSCVSVQLIRLLEQSSARAALTKCKAVLVGGSTIPEALLKEAALSKIPVFTTYGLTEMASQVATARYPDNAKILNQGEVKIALDGEIYVRGEKLFKGYVYGDKVAPSRDNEGWLHTGDLGRLADDGGLFVFGRKDNMFISGGENIHPEEIEHVIGQMASIELAVVVATPHDEYGFRPSAIIKTRNFAPINREALNTFLVKHLPKYKIPDHYYLWPDSIDDRAMKIDRKFLASQIIGHKLHLQAIQ